MPGPNLSTDVKVGDPLPDILNETRGAINAALVVTDAYTGFLQLVQHGSTAAKARPGAVGRVRWEGTVAPANALTHDEWLDSSAVPPLLRRFTSSNVWAVQNAGAMTLVVRHGSTAGTTRPADAAMVVWVGSVQPSNALADDEWQDKSATPAVLRRYNGSSWDALGGGTGGSSSSSANVTEVKHGTNGSATRPGDAGLVRWYGSVTPANAAVDDEWADTSTSPVVIRHYNGAAWAVIGASVFAVVVKHGTSATTARPVEAGQVEWIGSTQPSNAAVDDLWLDKSVVPAVLRRYNNTSWETLGGGTGSTPTSTANVTRVNHGSTAATARPTDALLVRWYGTVAPTAAASGDEWEDTSASPVLLRRYNGTAWAYVNSGVVAVVVKHGSTASTARPVDALLVRWYGTVAPTNAATDDEWVDKSTTPATLRRYTGTAFEVVTGSSANISRVNHGATAATARPTDAALVRWIGSVAPTNALAQDEWLDQSASVAILRRNNSTGWPAVNAGAFASVVKHAASSSVARPLEAIWVQWIGTVAPANALNNDEWLDTSASPAVAKRYNLSTTTWEVLGGSSTSTAATGTVMWVQKNSDGTWPGRPTSDSSVMVIWKGPDPSPASGYVAGVDTRFVTG